MKQLVRSSTLLFLTLALLSACDSPAAMTAQTQGDTATLQARANIVAIQPGNPAAGRLVQIADTSTLPEQIRNAQEVRVIVDNSKTLTTVTRNPDGSLSFVLPGGFQLQSAGTLPVLLVGDRTFTQAVQLLTGAALELDSPALTVGPSNTITLGTDLDLKANLKTPAEASNFDINWAYASALSGPWQPISGRGPEVSWDGAPVGSHFLRLEMIDRRTLSQSYYTTPTPVIYVQDSDNIATVSPAAIVQGDKVELKANLPEFRDQAAARYTWAYSLSAQGGFQPIAGEGATLNWEPPRAGSYFLRIQASLDGKTSTYTSTKALVQVSDSDSIFSLTPPSGSLVRGNPVTLSANLPSGAGANQVYTWFYGFSPVGSFSQIPGNSATVTWTPNLTGDLFLRVRVADQDTQQARTFTSSKALVLVRDSDSVFRTEPSPANLIKGEDVKLFFDAAPSDRVNWSYASSAQGPFLPIPQSGKQITWAPPSAGSFFVRAESVNSDGTPASFTSASALVFVTDRANPIVAEPSQGVIELGQGVRLNANIQQQEREDQRYTWSYSTSQTGPFIPLEQLEDRPLRTVNWYPTQPGSYYVKVDITNPNGQSTVSFTSQNPVVQVRETQPFFSTSITPGRIEMDDLIDITARFNPGGRNFNYGWGYSRSTAGPFISMGGSSTPTVTWRDNPKPVGSYYVRFQATLPGSVRSVVYISKTPVVFVSSNLDGTPDFGN
jgi:hypothetical protein